MWKELLLGSMVRPFSCVVVGLVRQCLAVSFTRGFFHLGKWLVGELPGAALRWWPLGVGCGSNCFLPALGLSVWTSSVHLGRRAPWVLGVKGGRCDQSRKPVCSLCFYDSNSSSLTHPLSSQRRSILFQFSIVESSLLSDLDSPFAIRIFLVQSQALGRTSEYHVENTD